MREPNILEKVWDWWESLYKKNKVLGVLVGIVLAVLGIGPLVAGWLWWSTRQAHRSSTETSARVEEAQLAAQRQDEDAASAQAFEAKQEALRTAVREAQLAAQQKEADIDAATKEQKRQAMGGSEGDKSALFDKLADDYLGRGEDNDT